VIDNASADGSAAIVLKESPAARLIQNRTNRGYARASNQGLARAAGRHLLLLNPDTLVRDGTLQEMASFLDSHPRAGIVGVRHTDADGRTQPVCRSFPTYLSLAAGRESLLTRLIPYNRLSRRFLCLDLEYDRPREVDFPGGACLMLRRQMVDAIGRLDERFFLFAADTDLCFRAREEGWSIHFLPQVSIVHFWGGSRQHEAGRSLLDHHRGLYRFFVKHRRPPLFARFILAGGGLLRVGFLMFLEAFSATSRSR
jgi:GT2 family glycosyltransferase